MGLPTSGTITFVMIRNEFVGVLSSSNTDLFNLNFYRGKTRYYLGSSANTFPVGAIAFSDFYGTYAADPNPPPPPPGDGGGGGT